MTMNPGQTFNFFPVPTDVHFGYGVVRTLPDRIKAFGTDRAFVVTDPGIKDAGLLDTIARLLRDAGVTYAIFDRVKADSGSRLTDETAAELKASGAGVVVGIGGGSSLDTAKAAAALATNPGSSLDYVGLHKLTTRPLPMIAIPTTAGTGSEVTLWSVFTDETRDLKVAIGSFLNYPAVALCDPELTLGLPPLLTAATGMDALGHAIECYTNKACQPISASLALPAIELIGRHLRTAVRKGRDREARYGMLLASTMAGIAMNPTRLGLAHALAMPLGSWDLRVPHGIAIACTLPIVMEFNHRTAPERYAAVARALGESTDGLAPLAAAARSVAAVRSLSRDIGLLKGLGEYGVHEGHVGRVVVEAMKSGNVTVNPRETSPAQLEQILRDSL
jgi:alcohol dehydrogenase class IV